MCQNGSHWNRFIFGRVELVRDEVVGFGLVLRLYILHEVTEKINKQINFMAIYCTCSSACLKYAKFVAV